jgi:hypothetical protein
LNHFCEEVEAEAALSTLALWGISIEAGWQVGWAINERDVHVEKDRAFVALCDGVVCIVCGLSAADDVALER